MNSAALLPPPMRDVRGRAFAAAIDRGLALDPWQACPLAVEHAPAEVLWELARQFDVAGPLFQAMRTRPARERLIKNAILLQQKRGTPWAVEEIMRLLGYTDALVLDRARMLIYDGEALHDGEYNFDAGIEHWGDYKIRLYIDSQSRAFTAADRQQAAFMAADWQPLRCRLTGWLARHAISAAAEDPALEAASVYQAVLLDKVGNRQPASRTWIQHFKDNSCALRWRLLPSEFALAEAAAVCLTDRSGEDLWASSMPVIEAAPDVTIEGIWHFEVLK